MVTILDDEYNIKPPDFAMRATTTARQIVGWDHHVRDIAEPAVEANSLAIGQYIDLPDVSWAENLYPLEDFDYAPLTEYIVQAIVGDVHPQVLLAKYGTPFPAALFIAPLSWVIATRARVAERGGKPPQPMASVTFSATSVPADGATPVTIAGVVAGTTISVTGPGVSVVAEVTDAPVTLTFDLSGVYTVQLSAPFHETMTVTINAT